MSCEIRTFGHIPDLQHVQEYFGFTDDPNWLNAVFYSLSPTGEVLSIAHGSSFVVLSAIWDNKMQQNQFTITWKGSLEDENDIITSIICLPIAGLRSNNCHTTEWTAIVLGLSSGTIIFFTDTGDELLSQQWHMEPVQNIRAQCDRKSTEELQVFYLSCVCIAQSVHLLSILRSMKLHFQKGKYIRATDSSPENILHRKWAFDSNHSVVTDGAIVGQQKISTYDYLLASSFEGSFRTKSRITPPQHSLVVGVGDKPYVGFHYAMESYQQPVLSDVARAVASKVKSALPTWLTGSQATMSDPQPQSIIPNESMYLRLGLCDYQRSAIAVWLSPNNHLAVVSDNLGRIVLIDCQQTIAVRIWKGYRDAQCSFIKVAEKLPKDSPKDMLPRHTLFLVIYAPRNACLEVWSLQHGPKVAAFSASKSGQLLYNGHTLMGSSKTVHRTKRSSTKRCIFLDPNDKTLKEFYIPFHCALSDVNSKTAKDLHLLRRIKLSIRNCDDNEMEQLIKVIHGYCCDIQTNEIRTQCIEILARNRYVSVHILKCALDVFLEQCVQIESKDHDHHLDMLIRNYKRLVDFYLYVQSPSTFVIDKVNPTEGLSTELDIESDILNISEDQIKELPSETVSECDMSNEIGDQVKSNTDPNNVDQIDESDQNQYQISSIEINSSTILPIEIPMVEDITDTAIIAEIYVEDNLEKNLIDPIKDENINENSDQEGTDGIAIVNLSENELENLQILIGLKKLANCIINETLKVKFDDRIKTNGFIEYLSAFDFHLDEEREIYLRADCDSLYGSVGGEIFRQFIEKRQSVSQFSEHAKESTIESVDLMKLLLFYWLELPFEYEECSDLLKDMNCFSEMLQQICALSPDQVRYDYNSTSFWWQNIREICLEHSNTLRSLLIAIMCRNHAIRYRFRENSSDENSLSDDDRWEQVSQESAEWGLLVGKLDDIALLEGILSVPIRCKKENQNDQKPLPIVSYTRPVISLKSIISGGKGIISELVAKWITSSGCTVNDLFKCEQNESEEDEHTDDQINLLQSNLKILRHHFPFSMQTASLLCQMTWEYMIAWSKNIENFTYLNGALVCLNNFDEKDYAIKHGLCCLVWNVHIKIPLEETKKLIDQSGGRLNDKICQQLVGFSFHHVCDFLDHCLMFFDQYLTSLAHEKIDLKFEEILQDGRIPITLLALQQNQTCLENLNLHRQLAAVLHIIAALGIKHIRRPISNLFNDMSNESFFTEINRPWPYAIQPADPLLKKRRLEFLSAAIAESMVLIREDLEQVYLYDHIQWIDRIEKLANIWDLDTAPLLNTQIVQLYTYGWDDYAAELLEGVLDTHDLGLQLLKIAGRRLNLYIQQSTDSTYAYVQVASIGTILADFLDNLRGDTLNGSVRPNEEDISLQRLINLTAAVFKCLSKAESKELRIVGQLYDACMALQESKPV